MSSSYSSPALWPFLIALLLLTAACVAVAMRKLPKRFGIPLALLSLVLVAASLVFVRGDVIVSAKWSNSELRRPTLDANDVPFSDVALEEARINAYKDLSKFPNLLPFWMEERHLKSGAGSMQVADLRVRATPTGIALTTSVPLILTFLEEKPMLMRSSFMEDLVSPECQRNLVINELRRNGAASLARGIAKVENLVEGRCAAWAKAEFNFHPFVVH